MIKGKTVRAAKKRFKKNSSGNFKYKHANLRHLLTKKDTKRKRRLRKKSEISNGDRGLVMSLFPCS